MEEFARFSELPQEKWLVSLKEPLPLFHHVLTLS